MRQSGQRLIFCPLPLFDGVSTISGSTLQHFDAVRLDQRVQCERGAGFALAPAAVAAVHEQRLRRHPVAHVAARAAAFERKSVSLAWVRVLVRRSQFTLRCCLRDGGPGRSLELDRVAFRISHVDRWPFAFGAIARRGGRRGNSRSFQMLPDAWFIERFETKAKVVEVSSLMTGGCTAHASELAGDRDQVEHRPSRT